MAPEMSSSTTSATDPQPASQHQRSARHNLDHGQSERSRWETTVPAHCLGMVFLRIVDLADKLDVKPARIGSICARK